MKTSQLTLYFKSGSSSAKKETPLPPDQSCDIPKIQMNGPIEPKVAKTEDSVDLAIKDSRKALMKENQTNPVEVNKRNQSSAQGQEEDIFPRQNAGQLKRAKVAGTSEIYGVQSMEEAQRTVAYKFAEDIIQNQDDQMNGKSLEFTKDQV